MNRSWAQSLLLACLAAAIGLAMFSASAGAAVGDGGAEWRLEQPQPPNPPGGTYEGPPLGLGKVGDIEFWAPNRAVLTTDGNGSTIPQGLWAYDGQSWHELATVCGATDGRIAWAGPEEFWTVSDGRAGQAAGEGGRLPPLEDDTLCHIAGGQVVTSYATLAFQASSYQAMHGAGCLSASDCWFAGDPLAEPQVGAFHLHWDGSAMRAVPYPREAHAIEDMRAFQGHLYESVRFTAGDVVEREGEGEQPALHLINPKNVTPAFQPLAGLPLYGSSGGMEEFPEALDFLHLAAGDESLWAAASAKSPPSGSAPGQVTVLRLNGGSWTQLIGPKTTPSGAELFPGEVVQSIAAEPGTGGVWVALDTKEDAEDPNPTVTPKLAWIAADGTVSQEELGAGSEGTGAAAKITCPAAHDCWMATTRGWLFHLTDGARLNRDTDPAFAGLITYRPPDEGVPQVVPDAPPADDSGLLGEPPPSISSLLETSTLASESRVAVPLVSHLHTRLVHGTTLELKFHLAVKARVRLLAMRRRQTVAATSMKTLAGGNRKLLLQLNRSRWPTKLDLQAHALAKLPTVSTQSAGVGSVSTGFVTLPKTSTFRLTGGLP